MQVVLMEGSFSSSPVAIAIAQQGRKKGRLLDEKLRLARGKEIGVTAIPRF
jgi:hypothetical protein